MPKPLINLDELPAPEHNRQGDKYESFDTGIAKLIGARKLGYSHTVLPPGKLSCPFHNHWDEEELFIVLSGKGSYRYGDTQYPVRAGHILAAPPGGRDTAHHLINDSDEPLVYLSISTKSDCEVVEYPDSGKVGIRGNRPRQEGEPAQRFWMMLRDGDPQPDYWEGEE
ncbi:MAG: cupin domain-containing protein [Burkholderiales bacterium]|nr:cupin domain-containing protein [Burkholderiales bacterium]